MEHFSQAANFAGLDLHHSPEDLEEGFLTQADNFVMEGTNLVLRPGLTGMFPAAISTAWTTAAYEPISFTDANQNSWIVLTASGKLWKTQRGTNTWSEILLNTGGSVGCNSAESRLRRSGKWGYMIDGSAVGGSTRTDGSPDGSIYRFDLNTATVMGNFATPNTPTATQSNQTLIDCSSLTPWSTTAGANSANLVTNPGFESSFTGWTQSWADGRIFSPGRNGSANCSLIDNDYGSNIGSITGGQNDRLSQVVTAPLIPGSTTAHSRRYQFSIWGDNRSSGSNTKTLTIVLQAINAGGQVVDSTKQNLDYTNSGWKQTSFNWQIDPQAPEPVSIKIVIGNATRYSGNDALYIDDVSLSAISTALVLSQPSGNSIGIANQSEFIGSDHIVYTISGSTVDYSKNNIISVAYSLLNTSVQPPNMTVTLTQRTNATLSATTGKVFFDIEKTNFFFDISGLPLNIRTDVGTVSFNLTDDLPAGTAAGPLFSFGPIIASGNLSINESPYTWLVTEAAPAASPPTETPASLISNAIIPTSTLATAKVSVGPLVNTSQTVYNLYRYGGSNTGGIYTLVAQAFVANDTQYGTPNPYVTWNHTTGVFVDNTPDEWLLGHPQLPVGADNPPLGAQAVASWQNRLWLAVGSKIYGSWASDVNESSQLHFTNINIPDDPQAILKGATFSSGGTDNDPVQAMFPFGTSLIVFKKRSVWVLSGSDPSNFTLNSYLIDAGIGLVAPRAACINENQVWFLGPNGVNVFNGSTISPVSTLIDKAFPNTGDIQPSSPIRNSYMVHHGYRLFLFMPDTLSTRNNIAYVFDNRNSAWTKLLNQPITSGVSFGSAAGNKALFLAGFLNSVATTGQLFELAGIADTPLQGGASSPISFAVTTRAYGREGTGEYYWTRKAAQAIRFHLVTNTASVINLRVYGDNGVSVWGPKTYNAVAPITTAWVRTPSNSRGQTLQGHVDGSSVGPLTVNSLALEFSEGYTRNG